MLFSAEKACWPDVNMKLHFNSDSPYRYLNSGGFMGNVKSIKMLINCEFADTYDDQLLMQKNYVKYNVCQKRIKKKKKKKKSGLELKL